MTWLNEYEVEDAARAFADHPTLGPATRTLENLVNVVNRSSDGWPYWQKPSRAAAKLQGLIYDAHCRRWDEVRTDVTPAEVKAAYRPIRAFLTRNKLECTIVEPA